MTLNKFKTFLIVATAMSLPACGGGGGGVETRQTSVPIGAPTQVSQDARYSVVFLDSVTGLPVFDSLKVTLGGAAQLKASDGSSLNGKSLTTSIGVVPLRAVFTDSAKSFTVQVADTGNKGWIPTGTTVVGDASVKNSDITIELKLTNTNKTSEINASDAPIAMAVANAAAATDGSLTSPVSVQTAPKTVTNAEGQKETIGIASVQISAGTKGSTASGALQVPGLLKITSTYYSGANISSLSAFPGGFAAAVDAPASVLNGVAPNAGVFTTGGFAQFNVVDSAGNAIRNFDKPITLGIDLPKSSKGRDGNPVTVGSSYPVWSYDEATGKWVFEKQGVVAEKTPPDSSNFSVSFQTTHLSTWNLGFYEGSCTGTVNLVGRPSGDARLLYVALVGSTGKRWGLGGYITDSTLRFYYAPDTRVWIEVRDRGEVVGMLQDVALCGNNNVNVALSSTGPGFGTVDVFTSEACADGSNKRAIPTNIQILANSRWLGAETIPRTQDRTEYASISIPGVAAGAGVNQLPTAGNPGPYWLVMAGNPYTHDNEISTINVIANQVTEQGFVFTMPCKTVTVTGGSSG